MTDNEIIKRILFYRNPDKNYSTQNDHKNAVQMIQHLTSSDKLSNANYLDSLIELCGYAQEDDGNCRPGLNYWSVFFKFLLDNIPDLLSYMKYIPACTFRITNWLDGNILDIPEGVEWINDWAFMDDFIEVIICPKSLEKIHYNSFDYCLNLKIIDLSKSNVTYIGGPIITRCPELKILILPKKLEEVAWEWSDSRDGGKIIEDCSKLETVIFDGDENLIDFSWFGCRQGDHVITVINSKGKVLREYHISD